MKSNNNRKDLINKIQDKLIINSQLEMNKMKETNREIKFIMGCQKIK